MFALGACSELGIRVSITGANETEKFADINPVHSHAWKSAIPDGDSFAP